MTAKKKTAKKKTKTKKAKAGEHVQTKGQQSLGPDFKEVRTDPGEYMTVTQTRTYSRSVCVFAPDGTEANANEVAQGRFDGKPPGDASPYEIEIYMEHRPKWMQKGALAIKIQASTDKVIERAQELEQNRMKAIEEARTKAAEEAES